jgi:hypothetical protein
MFEKIGRWAEAAATRVSVSRRGFLGRLGHGALASAGVLGGLLALSNKAKGDNHTLYSCTYEFAKPSKQCYGINGCVFAPNQSCGSCPNVKCCKLVSQTKIGTC